LTTMVIMIMITIMKTSESNGKIAMTYWSQ
jgi:hypothetical protein